MRLIIPFLMLLFVSVSCTALFNDDTVIIKKEYNTNISGSSGFVYGFNNSVVGDVFSFYLYRLNLSTLSTSIDLSYKANSSWVSGLPVSTFFNDVGYINLGDIPTSINYSSVNNTPDLSGFVLKSGDTMTGQIISTLANGTAPFDVTSTTMNDNLNADLLDGQHASVFALNGANSDITSLSGLTTPLAINQGGTGNSQGVGTLNTNRFVVGVTDFILPSAYFAQQGFPTWVGVVISAGTMSNIVGTANHPGIGAISSSTSANSGGYWLSAGWGLLLAGGETTELIFKLNNTTNTTVRFGFHDTTSITAPVDGTWIGIAGTTLDGRTSNNSITSTTGTSYTITTLTWYKMKILINENATRVDFYLYAEDGTLLWTDYLTTNIPKTTGRELGHGIVATNSGTTALALAYVDYMNLYIDRNLTR